MYFYEYTAADRRSRQTVRTSVFALPYSDMPRLQPRHENLVSAAMTGVVNGWYMKVMEPFPRGLVPPQLWLSSVWRFLVKIAITDAGARKPLRLPGIRAD